ncbi:hypothetical protein R1sor_016365 [Riccia sorocarpa]|uniref:Beta-glucosidase n=1 Tax=Riccia sorocarpa TaxID=122646 RepID=A0ABD3HIX1_9MARC
MPMYKAVENGADVLAYIAWSLLDNFEWTAGYTNHFGLYNLDFETQRRYPKDSAEWFSKLLKSKYVPHH